MQYKYLSLYILLFIILTACTDDVKKLEDWPEWPVASSPVIEDCTLTTPQGGLSMLAGQTASLHLAITDEKNELDMAEITCKLGEMIIYQNTELLTGRDVSLQLDIKIPWVPNMNDGSKLRVKVSVTNRRTGSVSMELEEEKCVNVQRPVAFDKLYLVDDNAKVVELARISDTDDYAFPAPGVIATSFRIAQKLTADGNIDYAGYVWGAKKGQISLIASKDEGAINVNSTVAQALKTINFNTNTFVFSYTLSLMVNGVELSASTYPNFVSADVALAKGQEVEFKGLEDLSNILQPDFFTYLSGNKARFNGDTGTYSVLYNQQNGFIYIEQRDACYPNALWVCGSAFGAPQGTVGTASWVWDNPTKYVLCLKVSDNVFATTLYLENNFQFKFFKYRTWGNEITCEGMTYIPEGLFGYGWYYPDDPAWGPGHATWDFVPGTNFTPGVYRVLLDVSQNTCTVEKVK